MNSEVICVKAPGITLDMWWAAVTVVRSLYTVSSVVPAMSLGLHYSLFLFQTFKY